MTQKLLLCDHYTASRGIVHAGTILDDTDPNFAQDFSGVVAPLVTYNSATQDAAIAAYKEQRARLPRDADISLAAYFQAYGF